MPRMEASKTQVLRGYLPGQTFQHRDELVVRTIAVDTERSDVDPDIVFDNLEDKLARWQEFEDPDTGETKSRTAGFPDIRRFREDYLLREPRDELYYAVWPLVLRCVNPTCEKALTFKDAAAWGRARNPERCDKCGSRREQMPYLLVHSCGRDSHLWVPDCPKHGNEHVYLKDERSFETSSWRCRAPGCGGAYLQNMRPYPCACGERGTYVHRTIRQEDRFVTHTLSFVSFERAPRLKLSNTPGSDRVVVGYWLGLFDDYEQALVDAQSEPDAKKAEQWREAEPLLRKQVEAGLLTEETFENMRRGMQSETQGALAQVTELVPGDVCHEVGTSQRARERTLIFSGSGNLRSWRLADFRQVAEETDRRGTVAVIDEADERLSACGFSDLLVVENFPVALAAYGYTRLGRNPRSALLRAFPSPRKEGKNKGKVPIYVVDSKTEAVFFELDARRVHAWLARNGWVEERAFTGEQMLPEAKAAVLAAYRTSGQVAEAVRLLEHTLAHALIRNLGERSGFAENTMAEYHVPELLTFGLYADTHQEFTLGALVSLVEHRLAEWLDATIEGARGCDWDPQCRRHEGACMGCLHLSFGCDEFNEGLDRAVLFGAPRHHKRPISHGFWAGLD